MALFMDIHTMDGPVSAEQVAGAHRADLETQGRYGVDYRQYWVDEEHGRIFCLVEAPDADAAISVHREAHGLVADAIFPVAEGTGAARQQAQTKVAGPRPPQRGRPRNFL